MKKFLKVMSAFVLTGALLTGCGGTSDDSNNVKIGMITNLNASEQTIDEIMRKAQQKSNVKIVKHTTSYYNTLTALQMGLESGSVDEISTYECVAKYIMARNPKLELAHDNSWAYKDSFCFAVRSEDTALKASLDNAIKALQKDGTLDKLIKTYITDVDANDPPAVEIPHIEGAEALKVAVTGDLPPLDLILGNGQPAGFNTALLSEVAKRINRNMEIIDIDGDARAAALSSKRADVIFWAIMPLDSDMPKDVDTPEGTSLSVPYFTDSIRHLKMKG